MPHINGFEYQPTKDLNRLLREYGVACLNDMLPAPPEGNTNVVWQTDMKGNISASVPQSTGGGGVNPGEELQLPFYASTGSVVSPTGITASSDGQSLTVPFLATVGKYFSNGFSNAVLNPALGGVPTYQQDNIELVVVGAGWNLGNAGGWTVNSTLNVDAVIAQRGIAQNYSSVLNRHGVGDAAAIYVYNRSDGGITAQSDEGCTGITAQVLEPNNYFHGVVSSASQTGGTPTFAFTSGNNWTTDGAFMLNDSKGTIAGNLNGNSFNLLLNTGSGAAATFLNALPITGVTLPVSTAIGIATAPIADPNVAANNPALTSVTVTLAEIGGIKKLFTVGSVVTVAGANYPEQSIVQTAVDNGNGTQTLGLRLRNPNTAAIIFQGGIQGQYISFDANFAFSGFPSSYYAFGSLTGTDLIYGWQVAGGVQFNILPHSGEEAATSTGANSGFHLYPGAEIVENTDTGFACVLEQNGVVWSTGDTVINPHYPTYGGNTAFFVREQTTPNDGSFGTAGLTVTLEGTGIAGGQCFLINGRNFNPGSWYDGSVQSLGAPIGIQLAGPLSTALYLTNNTNGPIILVQNNNSSGSGSTFVASISYAAGGNLIFTHSTGIWGFDGGVDAETGFSSNHVKGISGTFITADSKTATVSGGIITDLVTSGSPGGITFIQEPFTTTAPGNFTVAHTLGKVPTGAIIQLTSGGEVWFQSPTMFDGSNVYLTASDTGLTGFVQVFG